MILNFYVFCFELCKSAQTFQISQNNRNVIFYVYNSVSIQLRTSPPKLHSYVLTSPRFQNWNILSNTSYYVTKVLYLPAWKTPLATRDRDARRMAASLRRPTRLENVPCASVERAQNQLDGAPDKFRHSIYWPIPHQRNCRECRNRQITSRCERFTVRPDFFSSIEPRATSSKRETRGLGVEQGVERANKAKTHHFNFQPMTSSKKPANIRRKPLKIGGNKKRWHRRRVVRAGGSEHRWAWPARIRLRE